MAERRSPLRERREELPELAPFDHLSVGICVVGEDRCIAYYNAAFARAAGLALGDAVGTSVLALRARESLGRLVDRCFYEQRVLSEADGRGMELRAIPYSFASGDRGVLVNLETRERHASAGELQRQNIQLTKYVKGLELLVEERTVRLRAAADQTFNLLLNVLPKDVAQRLLAGETAQAERFEAVTVLFVDIVGFTTLASGRDPVEVVGFLSGMFDAFDRLVDRFGVEKIKTIGDCYLAAGGLPRADPDHAVNVCALALAMRDELAVLAAAGGVALHARFGVNSGPVVAGVIGNRRFAYDIWGDTVNIASRLESHGVSDSIQIGASTWELVKDHFECEERGLVDTKGRGLVQAYWLGARK